MTDSYATGLAHAAAMQAQAQLDYAVRLVKEEASHERVCEVLDKAIPGAAERPVEPLELARYLATLSGKERRALGPDLRAYEEVAQRRQDLSNRPGSGGVAVDRETRTDNYDRNTVRRLVAHIALGSSLADFGRGWMYPFELLPSDPDRLAAVLVALETRGPADRVKVTDRMMRLGNLNFHGWTVAFAATAQGLIPRPDSPFYEAGFLAVVLYQVGDERRGRGHGLNVFLDQVVATPEFAGCVAAALTNDAVLGSLPREAYPRIGPAIAAAVAGGTLDRDEMLNSSAASLAMPMVETRSDVGRLTWEALSPTQVERAARAPALWSAVAHGHPRAVLTALESLHDVPRAADARMMANALGLAVARGTKASASLAWSEAVRLLHENELVVVAMAALENSQVSVVDQALAWLEHTTEPFAAADLEGISAAEGLVPPRLRERLAGLLKSHDALVESKPVPTPPVGDRAAAGPNVRVDAWTSADQLRNSLAERRVGASRPSTMALLVDALQRWDPADCGETIGPTVEAFRLAAREGEESLFGKVPDTIVRAVSAWFAGTTMPGARYPAWHNSRVATSSAQWNGRSFEQLPVVETDMERWFAPAAQFWLDGRLAEAIDPARQRRASFDLPSRGSGVLDFDDLVDRLACAEAELSEIHIGPFEWWHTLNRVDLSDTAAALRRLASLSSPPAKELSEFALEKPQGEVARDVLCRRALVIDNPRWEPEARIEAAASDPQLNEGVTAIEPMFDLANADNAARSVRPLSYLRATAKEPLEETLAPQATRFVIVDGWRSKNGFDEAWWAISEPFAQRRVSASLLLATVHWHGGVLRRPAGESRPSAGDDGRGNYVATVLRLLVETRREWGTFEAAFVARVFAGLGRHDGAEVLVGMPQVIAAGLSGEATGHALAQFCGAGGSGLKTAGARLQEVLEIGGDPEWVCQLGAGFVASTPEPPRDSTEIVSAWATAAAMLGSWRLGPLSAQALAPYAKGSSLRAQAASEILKRQ